ncbi:MAG: hypothetical protein ACREM3_31230 [Candidatus Rokuibacteriota bacterium]
MNNKMIAVVIVSGVLCAQSPAWADARMLAQASGTAKKPGAGAAAAVTIHGTVDAVDRDAGTVTLKGPKGRTVTLEVTDKQKLDAIKAGDPVVATYVEALAFRIQPAGTSAPGVSVEERKVGSGPGETPAGAVGRQVTATVTIAAIDKAARTVTVKGPRGNTETVKARDPKNLEKIKVGDLVEITYTQALAVSLDKPAKK